MSSSFVRRSVCVAAALVLAASGVVVGSITGPGQILALPGASESTVVVVEPTRVLDTRYNIGLTGQVVAGASRELVVSGVINTYVEATATTIARQVVPAGATGVLLNVTAVSPTAAGFLSILPGTATGVPATAGLNFVAGDVVANAITVALPTAGANAGKISFYYGAQPAGATMHVVADVVGYTTNTGLIDLVNRLTALETTGVAGPAGANGTNGTNGTNGANGANGTNGADGTDGVPVRRYGRTITSLTTVDSADEVGEDTSVTIGADGNPIISYYDYDDGALKVAACTNATCTAATITTVDSTADEVGEYTSVTVGADGNPIISYYDATTDDLKVAACTNATCTAATISTVDSTGDVGEYTSVTIGADGNPIISYHDDAAGDLKVAACTNATCNPTVSDATISIVDSTGNVGEYTSVTIGADGNPIISYYDFTNGDLKVAACTNATCTAATISTVDSAGRVGWFTSVTIGADGNPIISYYDTTNRDLKVAACTNATCTTATITTVDSTDDVGRDTSVTIGADGSPIISYYDVTNNDLKVAKLTRTSWTPNTWES